MARTKNSNGVQAKIEDLIESPCPEDLRRALIKYIKETDIFKQYIVVSQNMSAGGGSSYEFRPGHEADDLICNTLQLHILFKNTKVVTSIVEGTIDDAVLNEEIEKSEEELRKRFDAYAYWIYRLSSLKKVLKGRESDFKSRRLDDVLNVDRDDNVGARQEPFILRAVQNLESLEDRGRLISPTADALAEKATAMLSLGFYGRADEYAVRAIGLDKSCSQAWFVRTVVALEGRSKAEKELFSAHLRSQDAPALSSEERWAEERMEEVASKADDYEKKLKEILPQAIIHWPIEEGVSGVYQHSDRRMFARDLFIDLMFKAVRPLNFSKPIPSWQIYERNGLAEEYDYCMKDILPGRNDPEPEVEFEVVEGDEKEALKIIFNERDERLESWSPFYEARDNAIAIKEFKLLHLRYVTGNSRYNDHLKEFFERGYFGRPSEFAPMFVFNSWGNELFTTHLVRYYGIEGSFQAVSDWRLDYDLEVSGRGADIQSNRLRALFHYCFVRNQFSQCIKVANQAILIPPNKFDWRGVQDHTSECGFRPLDRSFWTYLKVRAAVEEFKRNDSPGEGVLDALLSVENPRAFFEKEESYCVAEEYADDASVYYIPPYGDSLLETTEWADCLQQALNKRLLSGNNVDQAKAIIGNLG